MKRSCRGYEDRYQIICALIKTCQAKTSHEMAQRLLVDSASFSDVPFKMTTSNVESVSNLPFQLSSVLSLN
jgi:hypothetical protein